MQKEEGLLPEDDEEGVAELRHLGQDEEEGPDRVVEASGRHHVQKLGQRSARPRHAEQGQPAAPDGQGTPGLKLGPNGHTR